MKRKYTKRQIQAQNTKDTIYRSAVALIEQHGFDNITIEDICKDAKVSVGSFYNAFQSKNDIMFRIFKMADDYFETEVATRLQEGTTKEKILRFFHYYAEYNTERGIDFVKRLYSGKNNLFSTKGRAMQNVLSDILREGQAKGDILPSIDVEEINRFLFVTIRGLVYDWCLHDGEYSLTEATETYMQRLLIPFLTEDINEITDETKKSDSPR